MQVAHHKENARAGSFGFWVVAPGGGGGGWACMSLLFVGWKRLAEDSPENPRPLNFRV